MDNGCAVKVLGLGAAAMMLLNAQSSPDPADLLEQARDKVIARLPPMGYACTATIDRSYFSRHAPQLLPQACEKISADRRKSRNATKLEKTDRLRLKVELTRGGEIYSWTGPGGFSRKVEELVQSGHIGTGALGAQLNAIFANPLVRFRLLGQDGKNFEFGFRVPVEASTYVAKAGAQWREMGYEGSLVIDPASLELKRLTIKTDELQAETGMCESSTTMEYPSGAEGVLLPSTAQTHTLSRDTTETEWATTFSDCGEAHAQVPERQPPALVPPNWAVKFKLVLTAPIDTSTAAAGDVVRARLLESIIGPTAEVAAPTGAMLTGRILRMEHRLHKLEFKTPGTIVVTTGGRYFFLIWMDFDRIEANGVISSIRARLLCGEALDSAHPCPFATMSDQPWDRALAFGNSAVNGNIVVPAGYTSTWTTGDPSLN
jgi:hypothetical protein